MDANLFPNMEPVAPKAADKAGPAGPLRLRHPQRHQAEMFGGTLDQTLPADHQARTVWAYVEGLNLSPLLQKIQVGPGRAGRDANDPRILVCLWLFATIDGVGSARELDLLCTEHLAYRWICGGVSMNYHTLADFRTEHTGFLQQTLIDGVATMRHAGLIDLKRVAQDGMKVRASAGASSFRRQPSLQECLKEAREQVTTLEKQVHEDPAAVSRRVQAARQRAAREQVERIKQALVERQKLETLRECQRQEKGKKFDAEKLRASTTDPEARRMKMSDGGTRPGYNVQLATTVDGGVIVGVHVTNSGGDGGQMLPMVEQIQQHYGQPPEEFLADGGFMTNDDIEAVEGLGSQVIGPIKDEEKKQRNGTDPYAPRRTDGPGVARWRQRMGTEAAKAIYPLRAQTAEWVNAGARNRGLYQVRVRGVQKVLAVALWHALAHNLLRYYALQAKTEQASAD